MKNSAALCLPFSVGLALAGVARAGSSGVSSTTTAAAAQSGPNAAKLQKARVEAAVCMRGQGIDVPDPSTAPGSLLRIVRILASYPTNKVQAAEQACASQIRQAFPNLTNLTPAQRAQRAQEARAYAACMRSHGISFPDPPSVAGNASAYLAQVQRGAAAPAPPRSSRPR